MTLHRRRIERGFTLIELMLSVAIGAALLMGLGYVVTQGLDVWRVQKNQTDAQQNASFALARMIDAVRDAERLLVPQNATPRNVLALVIGPYVDANGDGFADADKDQDGLTNEDPPADATNDGAAGVVGIDDDGDALTDEGDPADDDEDGLIDEDPLDGIDNDGDGLIDEDPPADANNDGQSGVAGVDDDGDSFTDESASADDDEDGIADDDWWDPVVFYLSGTNLIERLPNLNPASGNDYAERTIATQVTTLAVTALPFNAGDRARQVEISISVQQADGSVVTLTARARVGGGR